MIFTKKMTINKTSFLKSVMTLMTGTILSQAISMVASPVITRLYSPAEMGILSSFLAIIFTFGVISNGRLDFAVVIPKSDLESSDLVKAGTVLSLIFCFIVSILLIIFSEQLINLFNLKGLSRNWLNLLGIFILLFSIDQLISKKAIRERKFKNLSFSLVLQQLVNNLFKIGLGFVKFGVGGLLIGALLGYIVKVVTLIKHADMKKKLSFHYHKFLYILKKYKKFPLFSSWAGLLNSASNQLPIILIASFFSVEAAGFYSLSYRILQLPMHFIGQNVSNVFMEKASKYKNQNDELGRISLSIFSKLLTIGAVVLSIVLFYGDFLFSFVFGTEWVTSGIYAKSLSIWLLLILATAPLSFLFSLFNKQKESLFFNLAIFITRIGVILVCSFFSLSDIVMIKYFSIMGSFTTLLLAFRLLSLVRVRFHKTFYTIARIVIPIYLLQYVIYYIGSNYFF